MKKFSLSLFLIALILISNINYSRTLKLGVNSFSNSSDQISLTSLSLNRNQNTDDVTEISKPLPSFTNKGFKCIRHMPQEQLTTQCESGTKNCISQGLVIYGPNADGNMEFKKIDAQVKYDCTPAYFNLDKIDKVSCYTYLPTLYQTLQENDKLSINKMNHSFCYVNDTKTYTIVRQLESFTCDKTTFPKIEGTLTCNCFKGAQLLNTKLKPVFIPLRLTTLNSNLEYQCIKSEGKNLFGKDVSCKAYRNISSCSDSIEKNSITIEDIASLSTDALSIINLNIIKQSDRFYFDNWICPQESGLDVAVKYSKSSDYEITISCLSNKSEEDCFYGEMANQHCLRINTCKEAETKDSYGKVVCGTDKFTKAWGYNGFNTSLNTWCKNSYAWLKFDSRIEIKNKRGIIMLPNGNNACIPSKEVESKEKKEIQEANSIVLEKCLLDSETTNISKIISDYNTDSSLYQEVVKCNSTNFPDVKTNNDHWCNKFGIAVTSNGEINIGLKN